jgi:hypothetical protein
LINTYNQSPSACALLLQILVSHGLPQHNILPLSSQGVQSGLWALHWESHILAQETLSGLDLLKSPLRGYWHGMRVVLLVVMPFWHLKSTGEGGCLAWGTHKGARWRNRGCELNRYYGLDWALINSDTCSSLAVVSVILHIHTLDRRCRSYSSDRAITHLLQMFLWSKNCYNVSFHFVLCVTLIPRSHLLEALELHQIFNVWQLRLHSRSRSPFYTMSISLLLSPFVLFLSTFTLNLQPLGHLIPPNRGYSILDQWWFQLPNRTFLLI